MISRVGVRVVGRLAEVRVVEGDHVRRGQLLARLDLRSEAASRRSALAKGAAAQARAAQARALLEQDNQELARQRQLTAGGAAARAVVETVELRARADEEAARAAEAEAEAAAAEIERSSAELLARDVIAPMDGVVVGRPLAIGEIVGLPGSEPILELADFDHLNVEVDVPEAKLDVVAPGTACEVALDAHPGRRYRGRVAAIGARVNRAKATVVVKVRFDDAVEGVLPDMAAQVAFVATQDHPPKPDRH